MVFKAILGGIILCLALNAHAASVPIGTSADERMRQVTYDPNNVIVLHSHYGYQTDIEFSKNESIENVAIGDAGVWQAVPTQSHLFIKPMADSKTNMTVLTNKRSYHFLLKSSNNARDEQTFRLTFYYPDEEISLANSVIAESQHRSPMDYNWRYSYSGDRQLSPVQVFDDKQFTYFKFKNAHANPLPALFIVNPDRTESLVNYHLEGEYVVVNRVAKQFTLRHGQQTTCVYNNAAIGDWKKIPG